MSSEDELTFEKLSLVFVNSWRITGLMPFKGKTFSHRYTKLVIFLCYVDLAFMGTLVGSNMLHIVTDKVFDMKAVTDWLTVINCIIRYIIAHIKREDLMTILDKFGECWLDLTLDEMKIMKIFQRRAYYIRTFFCVVCWSNFFFYSGNSLVSKLLLKDNTTHVDLPIKFYIDIYEDPAYTIMFVIECITFIYCMAIVLSLENLGCYLIMFQCGYFRVLKTKLDKICILEQNAVSNNINNYENKFDLPIKDDVKSLVVFHKKLLKNSDRICDYIGPIYFWLIVTSLYNLSFLALQVIKLNPEAPVFALVMVWMFVEIFNCQNLAQYLLIESEAVSNAAFSAIFGKYYRVKSAEYALTFMMLKSRKPVEIVSGKILRLSLESFANMVKSAFSVFMVFRSFQT